MRKVFYSLAACSLMYAEVSTTLGTETTKSTQEEKKVETKEDIKASVKPATNGSRLKDFIEYATLDGYARGDYIYTNGRDGYGQGFAMVFRPNITTGEVAGFSFTSGIFFSKGSLTPDGNTISDFISGSRVFDVKNNTAIDVFGISNLFVTKRFEKAKTKLRVGTMLIHTPFNAPSGMFADRGMGAYVTNNSLNGMEFYLGTFGSWITDNLAIQTYSNSNEKTMNFGLGNVLTIVGAKGDFRFAGLKDLKGTLYYAYADRLIDAMFFGDLSYKFNLSNDSYVELLVQAAAAIMNENAHFQTSGNSLLKDYYSPTSSAGTTANQIGNGWARNRGVYNIRLNWGVKNYKGSVGYAGSFAQAYGAMLDSNGQLQVGGTLWNSFLAGGVAGFGFTGSGSYKGTDIRVAYTEHAYKVNQWNFKLGLTYVGGHNRLPQMSTGSARIKGTSVDRGGATVGKTSNLTRDAEIFEITPSITYDLTKNLSATITYSQIVGDMIVNRTKVSVLYKF